MSKAAKEKAAQWLVEHPNHIHRFLYSYDTLNRHCACDAWIHHLDGIIHEAWEATDD